MVSFISWILFVPVMFNVNIIFISQLILMKTVYNLIEEKGKWFKNR